MIEYISQKDENNKDIKYKITTLSYIPIKVILTLYLLKDNNGDSEYIKNYIIETFYFSILDRKILYRNNILTWKTHAYDKFPYDLKEWLQPFDKIYDSTTKTMQIIVSEEELFYFKLKYENYMVEDVSHKIIVKEI